MPYLTVVNYDAEALAERLWREHEALRRPEGRDWANYVALWWTRSATQGIRAEVFLGNVGAITASPEDVDDIARAMATWGYVQVLDNDDYVTFKLKRRAS